MPSCCVSWCRSHTRFECPGISFHRFPTNVIRLKEWIDAVRIERREENWLPSKGTNVCSMHFDDDEFYKSKKSNYSMLPKTAVPVCTMIRPAKTSISPAATSHIAEIDLLNNVEKVLIVEVDDYNETKVFSESNTIYKDFKMTNIHNDLKRTVKRPSAPPRKGSLLDTLLKSQEKKLRHYKNLLVIKNKRIALFRQQNARLKKKNQYLKDIVTLLRKR